MKVKSMKYLYQYTPFVAYAMSLPLLVSLMTKRCQEREQLWKKHSKHQNESE